MSVLLEAGGSDVLLMALMGHCIRLQLCKYQGFDPLFRLCERFLVPGRKTATTKSDL